LVGVLVAGGVAAAGAILTALFLPGQPAKRATPTDSGAAAPFAPAILKHPACRGAKAPDTPGSTPGPRRIRLGEAVGVS
jgi:hypothetical protein